MNLRYIANFGGEEVFQYGGILVEIILYKYCSYLNHPLFFNESRPNP